jgi:hypothetical protein
VGTQVRRIRRRNGKAMACTSNTHKHAHWRGSAVSFISSRSRYLSHRESFNGPHMLIWLMQVNCSANGMYQNSSPRGCASSRLLRKIGLFGFSGDRARRTRFLLPFILGYVASAETPQTHGQSSRCNERHQPGDSITSGQRWLVQPTDKLGSPLCVSVNALVHEAQNADSFKI